MTTIFNFLEEKFSKQEAESIINQYIEDFGLNGWDYLNSLPIEEAYEELKEGGYIS